ncbi:kelch repeat-containing protein [Conexibacter stalactiti]|uniref:Kelch repeat-containing protein n=1 Tax=Conexibacter stalactiti TaxID=1940611 RepID=A0ABU4HUQ8_9ACTN|nr:kelch repeat-containing protein [Conexibacter stalactiti]MDW5596919.1 kelch repeat-containing protein [Conexibacter stalactiti]MEC5037561.1 kelch repeat-containing protein [Conexibacter stalactiti]
MPTWLRQPAVLVVLALAALSLPPAVAQAAAPPAWQQTGPLTAARVGGTVVALPDGRVLVAGGYPNNPGNTHASAELYDPATGSWTATGSMAAPRYDGRGVLLKDGRVLVAGGRTTSTAPLASAELYDPVTGTWSAAAPMSVARYGHSATLLSDGSVLVAGGWADTAPPTVHATAERYDPATGAWAPAGSLPSPHASHAATALPDGSVIVSGGSASEFTRTADVARYSPATGLWTAFAPLPRPRGEHTALLLDDGALLVVGGQGPGGADGALLRLDPGTGSWNQLPLATLFGITPAARQLASGAVLVVNGSFATLFDPRSGQLAAAGTPPLNGSVGSLVGLSDGDILLVSGAYLGQVAARFTPRATVAVAPVDAGEQTTGRRGTLISVPVTVTGDVPIFPRATTLEGVGAADFEIVSDSCDGAALERGGSCFVGLRFSPRADGARSASLVLSAGELAGGRKVVALSGTGVAAAVTPPPAAPIIPPGAPPAAVVPRQVARRATEPRLRCGARRGRTVVCSGLPHRLGSGKARLSRNGIVHATGTLKNGRLTLTVRRRLYDRRYTLVVGGRRAIKVVLD